MSTHNLCFEQKYKKNSDENFKFLQHKKIRKICILHGHVFVMKR